MYTNESSQCLQRKKMDNTLKLPPYVDPTPTTLLQKASSHPKSKPNEPVRKDVPLIVK